MKGNATAFSHKKPRDEISAITEGLKIYLLTFLLLFQ
jgi:hypothetical protein